MRVDATGVSLVAFLFPETVRVDGFSDERMLRQ